MTNEDISKLASDICEPVYRHLPEGEYKKWYEAVTDRLIKEFGELSIRELKSINEQIGKEFNKDDIKGICYKVDISEPDAVVIFDDYVETMPNDDDVILLEHLVKSHRSLIFSLSKTVSIGNMWLRLFDAFKDRNPGKVSVHEMNNAIRTTVKIMNLKL